MATRAIWSEHDPCTRFVGISPYCLDCGWMARHHTDAAKEKDALAAELWLRKGRVVNYLNPPPLPPELALPYYGVWADCQ